MAVTIAGTKLKTMTFNGAKVKKWIHNGVQVYSAAVELTNLVGSNAVSHTSNWSDIGYATFNDVVKTIPTVPGHRYYVRAAASSWASAYDGNAYDGYCNAQFITTVVSRNETGHAIVTATGAAHQCKKTGERYNSAQGGVTATFYMVVDLTEIEAQTGVTYTPASFWAAIGSAVFYGTKEFEV